MWWQETSSAVSGEVETYRFKKKLEGRCTSEAIVGKRRVEETRQKSWEGGGGGGFINTFWCT